MKIFWKSLIGYGFVFWIILCLMDFLGVTNIHKYSKELDELYDTPVLVQKVEKQLESHLNKFQYRGLKFGWSLLVWNTVTFVLSILLCSMGRTITWTCWSLYTTKRTNRICAQLKSPNQYAKTTGSGSKIPVIMKTFGRSSDSNLPNNTKLKIDSERSCPNLLMERSCSNLSNATDKTSKTCRTIYKKDIYLTHCPGLSNEEQLEKQCKLLKDELHRIQTTSLKEHAILSRKLESINKEKREVNKQLGVIQKENRAAKQQLEELFQERSLLLKKLETVSKEFKSNTKSKKLALTKLEEASNNVEELRQQLEQVTRDKEILDKKLKLLESEYNKLHERFIASQQKLFVNNINVENLPEKDENNGETNAYMQKLSFAKVDMNSIPPCAKQTVCALASVSQTEFDMQIIQEKIKQLERNLENLNVCPEFSCNKNIEFIESELSLSGMENATDSQNNMGEESGTTLSEFSSNNSPRYRQWSEKVTELISKNKHQFSKIQAIASKMNEKAKLFVNIGDKIESADDLETEFDGSEPTRFVSSSAAFKNFLKSLNKLEDTKKELPSKSKIYF